MMSALVTGPVAARQSVPDSTRSVEPSVYVTSNWPRKAGRSPYWCGPNMPTFPAYQPVATVTPSALAPGRTSFVTSYVWYWTRLR
jgi:hypothetical protein